MDFKTPKSVIHIDDDELLRFSWKCRAEQEGIEYRGFSSFSEFEISNLNLSLETTFYIDYDLEYDAINGLEVSKELFDRGYRNLFLSTGHEACEFSEEKYIKGTLGKEAPF